MAVGTLLAQVVVVLLAARLLGALFRRIHQPQVLGEMLAGILLGPSLLGWAAPHLYGRLFPQETLPFLAILAQIAAVFFIFLVGLELVTSFLISSYKQSAAISH